MQREFTLDAGATLQTQIGFHAASARIDNPGQHTITILPYGITIDAGRVGVVFNYDGRTTVPRFVSTPLLPAPQTTDPAIITISDQPQVTDAGQLLPLPDVLPGAPGAGVPGGVSVVVGDGQLTISWFPVNSNPPVLSYRVRLDFGPPISANGTSITITGLLNANTYGITVSAVNLQGEGPSSGIIYAVPRAKLPWQPIIDASQQTRTGAGGINGTAPDTFPQGTSPVWNVQGGALYKSQAGIGIWLDAGAGFAIINPQVGGQRSILGSFLNGSGAQYFFIYHDGVGVNWLAVIFLAIVGVPCIAVQQRISGLTTTIAIFGTVYAAHTWLGTLDASVDPSGRLAITFSAIDSGGTLSLSASTSGTPIIVYPLIPTFPNFGILHTIVGSASQTTFSIGFSAP